MPSTCKPKGRAQLQSPQAELAETLVCLFFCCCVFFWGGCVGEGDSSIYEEKISIFIPYEGGIWKVIHYQRYFQTESLGPVPRSFHCFSGQNYSHLQHKLEASGWQLCASCWDLTLMRTCSTSSWTLALASPTPIAHPSNIALRSKAMDPKLPA